MLFLLPFCAFTSAIANRAMDPLIAAIATDFSISISAAAVVIAFFAIPYSLGQPILGPLGDHYGKARVLKICLCAQTVSLALVAIAPTFGFLLAARLFGGIASGGLMPMTLALTAGGCPPAERQQAIARNVAGSLTGFMLAASASGLLAAWFSWRAIFAIAAVVAGAATILTWLYLPDSDKPKQHISVSAVLNDYRAIFRNRRAAICFTAVFLEGIALYGTLPFVAPLLALRGDGGAAEAGFIIAGVGAGSLSFTLVVGRLLALTTRYKLMIAGGGLAMFGPLMLAVGVHWASLVLFFALSGFGYMMVHNSIHAEVAELSSTARSSAFALHSCSFFIGQGLGPLIFAIGLGSVGYSGMLVVYAFTLGSVGPVISVLFRAGRTKST